MPASYGYLGSSADAGEPLAANLTAANLGSRRRSQRSDGAPGSTAEAPPLRARSEYHPP